MLFMYMINWTAKHVRITYNNKKGTLNLGIGEDGLKCDISKKGLP